MQVGREHRDKRPSFRELEALHALVEARKTTSAAHKIGVSQPAISRAIQDLEHRVGKALFRREGGRLVPTADGILLYQQSMPIFDTLAGLGRGSIRDPAEPIRIIAPPTIAHRFLPDVMAGFFDAEPNIRTLIEVGTTSDVIASMAEGRYDFGITDSQLHHPSIVFEPFRRASAHAIMRMDHPLAAKPELCLDDLTGLNFVALTRRFSVRSTLDRIFADAVGGPKIVAEAATSAIACELVRRGMGLTIINPFPVAFGAGIDLAIRPFLPKIWFESCFVLSAAGPPPQHARRFMDFLRRHQRDDGYSVPLR
jgi:DNA-binding transcriptional LysR family regulator